MNGSDKSRKLWMASRNIRAIPPWKLIEILEVFKQASLEDDWDNTVRLLLQKRELKKDFKSYDKNPGGDRTYKAQLVCLGLIYDNEGKIEFTKAGKDLLNGHAEILLILRTMLLRQQYPSVYSSGVGVNISPSVKIKPILFLLKLAKKLYEIKPESGYLTKEDIAIAVIYGHSFDCFNKCFDKIMALRSGHSLDSLIDNEEDDLWTTRTKENTLSQKLSNILNIANTFDNWMASAQLVTRIEEGGRKKSFYNPDLEELIFSEDEGLIEDSLEKIKHNKISFQKRFGAWDGKKDTSQADKKLDKLTAEETILKNKFFELMAKDISSEKDISLFKTQMNEMGFNPDVVEKTILKYSKFNMTLFEDNYIDLATGGPTKGLDFEKATHKLIEKLGVDAKLTGQIKRKDSARGAYADIIVTTNKEAVIIDTKASAKYDLPSGDHSKACQNYIPNWKELNTEHNVTDAENLNSLCYIAGGFHPLKTFKSKLEEVSKETNVDTCAVKAWDLYKYIQKNDVASAGNFMKKLSVTDIVNLND